ALSGSARSAAPEAAKDSGKLSPSVRRLVEENNLDPGAIPASGKDGRLTKADVVDFLGKQSNGGNSPAAVKADPSRAPTSIGSAPAPPQPAIAPAPAPATRAPSPGPSARPTGARSEQRVPMTRLRQRIAQRLVEAQSTQALLTTFNEIDLS